MAGILDSFRLDGKLAIVTGSERGLGRGYTTALLRADEKRSEAMHTGGQVGNTRGHRRSRRVPASAASDYVTGRILAVDGGWLARKMEAIEAEPKGGSW